MAGSNDLLKRLTGGDRRSIGRSDEVAALVLKRPALFGTLIRGLRDSDPVVRMRAADAAEKASLSRPELLKPFKKDLLRLADESKEQELCWHLAQMTPRLLLTREERVGVTATFRRYLESRSSIVRTCAMQAIVDTAGQDKSLLRQARLLLRGSVRNGTAAMKARARKLLLQLEAHQLDPPH